MSYSLLDETAQLRWWSENELLYRDIVVQSLHTTIKNSLTAVNGVWKFSRVEGPTMVPLSCVSDTYTDDDVWNLKAGDFCMRPETTSTSYLAANHIIGEGANFNKKLPHCVWQVGKSFRREKSDGANAAKLRYFEFTQAEWQCIYSENTMVDYRSKILDKLESTVRWLTKCESSRVAESDRLPNYSESTLDIEVLYNDRWTEVASISIRKDFPNAKVLEIAFGIDRIVQIANVDYE